MSDYFSQVPDFNYVSRLPGAKISDYIRVKNLFKKAALADDIIEDLSLHTKYKIIGNDRPDNVAYDYYGSSELDWLVLTCNNIVNIQTEWPMLQNDFDRFLLDKYETYANLNSTHHYETQEIKNSIGSIVLPKGLNVPKNFSMEFLDINLGRMITIGGSADPITTEITNYDYEVDLQDKKREIYILKQNYLSIVLTDMERIMPYKTGSTQYVSETLVRGENIKLYS